MSEWRERKDWPTPLHPEFGPFQTDGMVDAKRSDDTHVYHLRASRIAWGNPVWIKTKPAINGPSAKWSPTPPEPVQDGWLPISQYAGEPRRVDLWSEQEGQRVTDGYLKNGRWCRFWSDGWSGGGDDIPVDGVTHFREIPPPPQKGE